MENEDNGLPESLADVSYRIMSRCCWSMCEKCVSNYKRTGRFVLCDECLERLRATNERMNDLYKIALHAEANYAIQKFEDEHGGTHRALLEKKLLGGMPLNEAIISAFDELRDWRNEEVEFQVSFHGVKRKWASQITSMLAEMATLGQNGCSRLIGFYADGDGDFHPQISIYGDKGIDLVKPKTPSERTKVDMVFDAG